MNNRGNRLGYKARTTQEQAALEKKRAVFVHCARARRCPQCIKNRARCPVCAGVY